MAKVRIEFIDIAKGLGILLVVFGHITTDVFITKLIYSFHMPLFFFLSGLTVKFDNPSFITKKIKTLIIPYYFWYAIFFAYWFIIERQFRDSNLSPIIPFLGGLFALCKNDNLLPNVVLWFLPCLFVTEMLSFYVLKNQLLGNNKVLLLICLISFGILTNMYNKYSLPFCAEVALLMMPFYVIGYYVKDKVNTILKIKINQMLLIFIGSTLFLVLFINLNISVDVRDGKLGNYFYFYVLSLIGIVSIICFSILLGNNYLLTFLGKNTLSIMIFHDPLKRVVLYIFSKLTHISIEQIRQSSFWVILILLLLVLIIIPAKFIIERYIPWSLGKANVVRTLES